MSRRSSIEVMPKKMTCKPIIGAGPHSALQGFVFEFGSQILGKSSQISEFAPEIPDKLPRLHFQDTVAAFVDDMFIDDLIDEMFMHDASTQISLTIVLTR